MTSIAAFDPERAGTQLLAGPAGAIEVRVDRPAGAPCGIALVAHPQPRLGGSAMHKVPHFLARALADAGWLAVRPNFRGVGASAGAHDEGIGETEDLLALRRQLREAWPDARLVLVGFSFGAFVQARVAHALAAQGEAAWRVALTGMPAGTVADGRHYAPPAAIPDALVVHGEHDERVPLASVLDWARPQLQPVVVLPGADHFFNGQLPTLQRLVLRHLSA